MIAVLGFDRRQGEDKAQVEVGLHREAAPHPIQHVPHEGARLAGVALLVLGVGQPVRRQGRVRLTARSSEQAHGLGCIAGRSERLVQPGVSLGAATQQLAAEQQTGRLVEEIAVGVDCLGPSAGCQVDVGFEAVPGGRLIADEAAGRQTELGCEEVERHHRGPHEAVLEGADVGLGVSIPGQLLLRLARLEASLLESSADPAREGAVVGRGTWPPGTRSHSGQCTRLASPH